MSKLPVSRRSYVSAKNLERKAKKWIMDASAYAPKGKRPEFCPENAALLVLDMQHFFLDLDSHAFLPAGRAILPNVALTAKEFQAKKLPVIFTKHALKKGEDPGAMGRWWKDVLQECDPRSEIVKALQAKAGKNILRKSQYDAFQDTNLEKILRSAGVRQVVISGVMTSLCCETTARSAFVRGFDVFFLADGTATTNEILHISALRTLAQGFAQVVSCREIISKLQ